MELIALLIKFLFPTYCVLCGRYGCSLCNSCINKFSYTALPYCPKCAGRLHRNEYIHKLCKRNSSLDGAFSLCFFEPRIQRVIWDYKYHFIYTLAPVLADLLNPRLARTKMQFDYLVPIPGSKRKRLWRGFDHISCLGDFVRIPSVRALSKTEDCVSQTKLSRKERLRNVAGVFSFTNYRSIAGKNILLLDDVFTTGSTLEAAAKVLKMNGARSVYSLTLVKDDRDFRKRGVK